LAERQSVRTIEVPRINHWRATFIRANKRRVLQNNRRDQMLPRTMALALAEERGAPPLRYGVGAEAEISRTELHGRATEQRTFLQVNGISNRQEAMV
jgi:hypothetical protein